VHTPGTRIRRCAVRGKYRWTPLLRQAKDLPLAVEVGLLGGWRWGWLVQGLLRQVKDLPLAVEVGLLGGSGSRWGWQGLNM
jgi:hypothetical protein